MEENLGKVTIAPNVLVTIAQRTASAVTGVDRLSESVPAVKRLFGVHGLGPGIQVRIIDDQVCVDVFLVAKRNTDLLQMGRQVQRDVTRAIQDIVGKEVREVNVHIQDVATELAAKATAKKGQAG
jgi:uncharacterized alkaline shock family protein YloU